MSDVVDAALDIVGTYLEPIALAAFTLFIESARLFRVVSRDGVEFFTFEKI